MFLETHQNALWSLLNIFNPGPVKQDAFCCFQQEANGQRNEADLRLGKGTVRAQRRGTAVFSMHSRSEGSDSGIRAAITK